MGVQSYRLCRCSVGGRGGGLCFRPQKLSRKSPRGERLWLLAGLMIVAMYWALSVRHTLWSAGNIISFNLRNVVRCVPLIFLLGQNAYNEIYRRMGQVN